MKLFRSLTQSPIESLSALVLVAVGIYVSSIGSSAEAHKTGLLTAGGLLTTFGGVLFAWVVSKAFTTAQARAEFQQQLGHLSRSLGQAAGQISRAVEQSQKKDISDETGLALISQANRMIYGQVNEISVIQGTGFDPADLLETATTLDDLARQLESDDKESAELEEVRRQLKEVRTSLRGVARTRTYSTASVECPSCGAENGVQLGDVPGDTASGVCRECGGRFNAHRASDGSAFSRPAGQEVDPVRKGSPWTVACPGCGYKATSRKHEGHGTLVCFGCLSPLDVDFESEAVSLGTGKYEASVAPIVGRKNSRPLVECPKCRREVLAFINAGDDFVGFCHSDRQVMQVPRPTFAQWRISNGFAAPAADEGRSSSSASSSQT